MTTIGLALIVKNEEAALPTLLASIGGGAFDQVVLVDTGSTDQTVRVFQDWAAAQPGLRQRVAHFEWVNDFSAARRYAQTFLDCDWEVWADADDEIQGASNLRMLAEQAEPQVAAFICGYNYAQDPQGNCVCYLKRERLVRRGMGVWAGRVHEAQTLNGPVTYVPADVAEWVHRKRFDSPQVPERNLKILREWVKDAPTDPRVLGYLGTEELTRGRTKQAMSWFRKYLALEPGWDEERAQIHRRYALALMSDGEYDKAIDTALEAIKLLPSWPDSYITLAEAYLLKGQYHKAIEWARTALLRGAPDTLLIVNPLDYVVNPRQVLAGAFAALERTEDAIAECNQILELAPYHGQIQEERQKLMVVAKREATAQTFCGCAEMLIAHDEQLKARAVLESAPHFVIDHPRVVALRSMLNERLAWIDDTSDYAEHYETGGTKPEDFVDDPVAVGNVLPRCSFLLAGLRELAAAA
jgi:tetratricopeptide (TPR) repeat protein